jgi:hypothetical protein
MPRGLNEPYQRDDRSPGATTVTVTPKPATFTLDNVASTEAVNTMEIRPRVTGAFATAARPAAQPEVSDALIARQKTEEVQRALQTGVDAQRKADAIALARYRVGNASYFDVINADRTCSRPN